MKPAEFQRARSPEHKALRVEAILDAASTVLDRDGIEATSLAAIAAEAGLAKSNLYRYFESREEILIRLLSAEAAALIADLSATYASFERTDDFKHMAEAFADACAARPRFCLLISQMAPILERNISVERVIDVKRGFTDMLEAMGDAIHRAAPSLGHDGAETTLKTSVTLVAGLWPAANPSGNVEKALEHPDISHFREDFRKTLARTMTYLMRGIASSDAAADTVS